MNKQNGVFVVWMSIPYNKVLLLATVQVNHENSMLNLKSQLKSYILCHYIYMRCLEREIQEAKGCCQRLRGVKLRVSAKWVHGFFGGDETLKNQINEDGFMPCGYTKNHRIV